MKSIILVVLILMGFNIVLAAEAPKTKVKYGPSSQPVATPLYRDQRYFQKAKNPAPDFWKLISYYVPQINESACSVASMAMAINAALAERSKTSEDKVISQEDLLEKVSVENWKARVSKLGYFGEHGVKLDTLKKIAEETFKIFGISEAKVEVHHVENASPGTVKKIESVLIANEKSGKNLIIANFNQQAFTDDADVGHIAPVGAYDVASKKVLILDPDRAYYEPYWVSLKAFVGAMATRDSSSKLNRGLITISW